LISLGAATFGCLQDRHNLAVSQSVNVIDDFNREALAVGIDPNVSPLRVICVLDRIAAWRGYPDKLRLDNGPNCVSTTLAQWAEWHGVELKVCSARRPMQKRLHKPSMH
jgi:putative transposase